MTNIINLNDNILSLKFKRAHEAKRLTPHLYPSFSLTHVYWFNDEKKRIGQGFIGIGREKIYLTKCAACQKDNNPLHVATGCCAYCPFDANNEIQNIEDYINERR